MTRRNPRFRPFPSSVPGWLFIILALAAWVYLGSLIVSTAPEDPSARVLVFVTIAAAVFLTACAVVYGLGVRLFRAELKGDIRIALIQAIPPALMVVLVLWLQSLRVLNLFIFAILFGLVVSLEYLLWPRDYEE